MKGQKVQLSAKEEAFCKYYATDLEFFGNGVQSYIQAYNPNKKSKSWYNVAKAMAWELLQKPKITERINKLLEEGGLHDVSVDKQLSFVIHQHADLGAKIAAIREYNKLKQRIIEKSETTVHLPSPILGGETKNVPQHDSDTEVTKPTTEN